MFGDEILSLDEQAFGRLAHVGDKWALPHEQLGSRPQYAIHHADIITLNFVKSAK